MKEKVLTFGENGPHRLYVDMARNLAAMGFLTVRFDLSGKGDSRARTDKGLVMERTTHDVQEVMDFVSVSKWAVYFGLQKRHLYK